jgi:hypothetical protein
MTCLDAEDAVDTEAMAAAIRATGGNVWQLGGPGLESV